MKPFLPTRFAVIFSLPLILMACTNDIAQSDARQAVNPPNSEKTRPAVNTSKPGTSFSFSHNYDGKTEPGDHEQIAVSLASPHTNGQVAVSTYADDGIEIINDQGTVIFDLAQDRAPVFNLELIAHQAGRRYVYIHLTEEPEGGNRSTSTHGIAIQVGAQTGTGRMKVNGEAGQGAGGEKLIIMPATEEINPAPSN